MTDPWTASVTEIARGVRRASLRATDVVAGLLGQIGRLDPARRAFVRVNPSAGDEAEAIDRAVRNGRDPGPLAGVPIAVKDNIATAGLETTCGSRILEGYRPPRDATAVARLRRAGAIILGKTNLDEFGMGSSTETSAYGVTRNPVDPDRVAGGSGGGSAVAVADGMAPVALGSDTGGSIRQPAAFCGVLGLRPTYGRVSRSGLVAFASSLDQIGPTAREPADLAAILDVISGPDGADATTAAIPERPSSRAVRSGARGLRVGVIEPSGPDLDPAIGDALTRAAEALHAGGARVERVAGFDDSSALAVYYLIATSEAASNLARYDGVRFGPRHDPGRGVRAMYRETRGRGFGAEVKRRILLGTYALSAGHRDAYYRRACRLRREIRGRFGAWFDAGFDLLLGPTTPTPAFRIGEHVDDPVAMYRSDRFTVPASLAGLPALSVPSGATDGGLPLAVQLVAPPFREDRLLQCAGAIA